MLAASTACAAAGLAAVGAGSPGAVAAVGTPAWGRPAGHVAVYVADPAEGTVTPIPVTTNHPAKPIPVGSFPAVITRSGSMPDPAMAW